MKNWRDWDHLAIKMLRKPISNIRRPLLPLKKHPKKSVRNSIQVK